MSRLGVVLSAVIAVTTVVQSESFPLKENGAIAVWMVAGPLPYSVKAAEGELGYYYDFLKTAGGEQHTNPAEGDRIALEDGRSVVWKTCLTDSSGLLDFREAFEVDAQTSGVAYAFCEIYSAEPRQVVLHVRSNDGVRVWVNDDLVHDQHVARVIQAGADRVPVRLRKGSNRLLVKVDQRGGGWAASVAVLDEDREPVQGISTSIKSSRRIKNTFIDVNLSTSPLILKTPEGDRQVLTVDITSGGVKDVYCRIDSPAWREPQVYSLGDIELGKRRFEFHIPILPQGGNLNVALTSPTDEKKWEDISVPQPRRWVVYLVQHVHTDIGYTRPQTEILPEHLRYIDYALDYCDLTDDYPDDARFRWTCEISWAVREYLKRRPSGQIRRLRRRIDEGRIEVTGMFLNMSEIATESSLAASLQPVRKFKDEHGIPVQTAMQDDVNGAAWCLVDYFSGMGIKYLTMGINKTRSLLPFDKPTPFWWESPSGKRVLAYRADHYMTANTWQIHQGDLEAFRDGLIDYLESLEKRNYPFDRISVQFSGYRTDNSPPAMVACDLVRKWNETYSWPRLRLATAREFLQYIEENYESELPVHRQAWPDWWTDGFGSAARETAASRQTHIAVQSSQTLLAMAALLGARVGQESMERAAKIQEDLLFYDEHTFGAAESISDPMSENSMVQWGEKAAYVWDAVKNAHLLREEAVGLLQEFVPRANVPSVVVFNTLNWPRSGLVEVFIDHEILPFDRQFRIVDSVTGRSVPAQPLRRRTEGTYWALWVEDIPPLGYKQYRIEVGQGRRVPDPNTEAGLVKIENDFYTVTLDPATGAVTSLIDKETGAELVDGDCPWHLGQVIHETLSGGRELRRNAFQRSTVKNVRWLSGTAGRVWKSIRFRADLENCAGLEGEIRLFKTSKRIDFLYNVRKNPVTDPEAIYVSFPFLSRNGKIIYEAQGGFVTPGVDQLPGSSSDWHPVQGFVCVRNQDGQVVFGSDEVPLVQCGDFNLGKWQEIAQVEKPHVYSWVMNNYWFTNFRASQEGEFKWRYYLTSLQDTGNEAAVRFAYGSRVPFVSRVFPPDRSEYRGLAASRSIIRLNAPGLLLVEARPAYYSDGVILHLREVNGERTVLNCGEQALAEGVGSVDEVNVIEETLETGITQLPFEPFEVKFIRLMK